MRRGFFIFSFIVLFVSQLFSLPPIPQNWFANNPPRDGDGYRYAIGFSEPCVSEKEATENAWQSVFAYIASGISTLYESNVQGQSYEEGLESGVFDTYSVTISKESWKTTVPLYGVTRLDSKTSVSNGLYIVKILACISDEDYARSKMAIEDEETCALAYGYFTSYEKMLPKNSTYRQWIKQNCIAVQLSVSSQKEKWVSLMQVYLKKLYRNAPLFPCSFEGVATIFLPAKYAKSIRQTFLSIPCLAARQKGSSIFVTPHDENAFDIFSNIVNGVKDSHRIAVFGKEEYSLPSGDLYLNNDGRAVHNFKRLAEHDFSFSVVPFEQSFEFYEDMKGWAVTNKKNISARYLVFCTCETTFSDRDRIMHIKPMVDATLSFLLYDIETGDEYSSDEVVSMPGCAVLSAITDAQVIAKSRQAVDNIGNADKNPNGLLAIMESVFSKLP